MTTITYKDGVLAADTMITDGIEKQFGVQKIFQAGHWVVAFAGNYGDGLVVLEWLVRQTETFITPSWRVPEDYPDDMDVDVLVVVPGKGLFELDSKGRVMPIPSEVAAIGSGAKYATGAMSYGASAEKAVRIAMQHDVYTGGDVTKITCIEQVA